MHHLTFLPVLGLLLGLFSLTSTGLSNSRDRENSQQPSSDLQVAKEFFHRDGLVIGLIEYFESYGFYTRSSPQLLKLDNTTRCSRQCDREYLVTQVLQNNTGDQRTVRAYVTFTSFGHTFLFDKYESGYPKKEPFLPASNDREYTVFSGGFGGQEPLASYIFKAGKATDSDLGFSRRGHDESIGEQYYFARDLICQVQTDSMFSCSVSFIGNEARFQYDAIESEDIVQRLKKFGAKIDPELRAYVAKFIECGPDDQVRPSSGCWVIGL